MSAALGPEWTVVEWAAGCTACGSPTSCPKWTVTGTLSCEPYPCLCKQTRQQAYEDHGIEDAACWWKDKKRPGRLASRCPCWGRIRDDALPQDCCARHERNPMYVPIQPEFMVEPVASTQPGAAAEMGEAPKRAFPAGAAGGSDATGSTPGYTRLWPPHEITCPCRTPWDGSTRAGGYHCVACHTNWVNYATGMVHQRDVRDPCRSPESIVDVTTGRALLYARDVRGMVVWAFSW